MIIYLISKHFLINYKLTISLPQDGDTLKLEAKFLIQKLLNLQKNYYKQFDEAIKRNKNLKELLLKYNEKYRVINKKAHRLQEKTESINIQTNLATFINREEIKRVNDALQNNKNIEMKIYQNTFKTPLNEKELKRFIQERESLNGNNTFFKIIEKSDKTLLVKVFAKISKAKRITSLLDKNQTMNFVRFFILIQFQ